MTLGALGARPSSRVACRGRGRERGAAEAGGASRARVHLRLRRTPVCTHPQRQSVRRCTTRAPPPHQLESRDRLARALALGLHLAPRPSPPPSSCQKEKLGSEPRLLRLRLSALLRRKLLCLIFDLARLLGRLLASWRPWPHAKAASSTCRLIDRRSRKASEEAGPWTPWPMAPCDGWLLFLKVDTPLLGARGHPGTGVDTAVCAAQRRPKNRQKHENISKCATKPLNVGAGGGHRCLRPGYIFDGVGSHSVCEGTTQSSKLLCTS